MKKPGRPKAEIIKTQISVRLDQDVLDYYKSTGPGWQTRINNDLRRIAKIDK